MQRFEMSESKPVPTPMEEAKTYEARLEYVSEQDEKAVGVPYREAIGSLMYLMIGTRPDISYAVGKLAQFCEDPKVKHCVVVKRVLRYVNGTRRMGLCYDGLKGNGIFGYSDSDWAADVTDRKCISGYVFMMHGAAVSWCSRKQTVTTTSSCEAEYIALSMSCKEAVWLNRIVASISPPGRARKSMKVLSDSQSAISLSGNESINRRNKHIDITYHYVRDVTDKDSGQVELEYTPTSDMVADMMNKPLGRVKFEKLTLMAGIKIQGEC